MQYSENLLQCTENHSKEEIDIYKMISKLEKRAYEKGLKGEPFVDIYTRLIISGNIDNLLNVEANNPTFSDTL